MAHKFDYLRNDPTAGIIQDFIGVYILNDGKNGSKNLGIRVFTDLASFWARLILARDILFNKEFAFVITGANVDKFVERITEAVKETKS